MRAGWLTGQDDAGNRHAGVSDLASRWGIKGSSEVSDGLTAVYRFETKINAANAESSGGGKSGGPGGRLSYVGLSGGFGQLVLGQVWSATSNHIGAMADNNWWMGHADVTGRHGNVISYSVDIGSVSMQADLTANNGEGANAVTGKAAAPGLNDGGDAVVVSPAVAGKAENKSVDGSEIGATLQLGENGSIAVAHKKFDMAKGMDKRKTLLAGQYTVGGMTMHLGVGQIKMENDNAMSADADNLQVAEMKTKTAFYGIRGGLGDTGVSFVLQVQSKKDSGKNAAVDENTAATNVDANKRTPWTLSLTRSLGGGASVFVEHANHDEEGEKSDSVIGLAVSF